VGFLGFFEKKRFGLGFFTTILHIIQHNVIVFATLPAKFAPSISLF